MPSKEGYYTRTLLAGCAPTMSSCHASYEEPPTDQVQSSSQVIRQGGESRKSLQQIARLRLRAHVRAQHQPLGLQFLQ
jgi:hypothetical protein